jgi:hypothetical protein
MSAQLASPNSFSAHLALAAGVSVTINAPTLADLSGVVGKLQPVVAANDTPTKAPSAAKPNPHAATPAPQVAAGNDPASTGTPANAPPAASGSAGSGDAPRVNYDQVKERVLALAKISREKAMEIMAQFKAMDGTPVDKGPKLQLQDYPAFIAAADKALEAAKVPA